MCPSALPPSSLPPLSPFGLPVARHLSLVERSPLGGSPSTALSLPTFSAAHLSPPLAGHGHRLPSPQSIPTITPPRPLFLPFLPRLPCHLCSAAAHSVAPPPQHPPLSLPPNFAAAPLSPLLTAHGRRRESHSTIATHPAKHAATAPYTPLRGCVW
mmetsp:Transcript_34433/g.46397  ORF Transcript_34433/g.46397 Transcript_34433/m.46397 type:complete len:156 (-) Transcript_34433:112-579(-)